MATDADADMRAGSGSAGDVGAGSAGAASSSAGVAVAGALKMPKKAHPRSFRIGDTLMIFRPATKSAKPRFQVTCLCPWHVDENKKKDGSTYATICTKTLQFDDEVAGTGISESIVVRRLKLWALQGIDYGSKKGHQKKATSLTLAETALPTNEELDESMKTFKPVKRDVAAVVGPARASPEGSSSCSSSSSSSSLAPSSSSSD